MYFPWVRTPFSHFHVSKEASKQSTNTTATTCTFSCGFFFFSLQHHATIGRGHPIPFLPSCWPRVGRAEG